MFEHCGQMTPEHGYTISSPCEPDGSGELKSHPASGWVKINHLSLPCYCSALKECKGNQDWVTIKLLC